MDSNLKGVVKEKVQVPQDPPWKDFWGYLEQVKQNIAIRLGNGPQIDFGDGQHIHPGKPIYNDSNPLLARLPSGPRVPMGSANSPGMSRMSPADSFDMQNPMWTLDHKQWNVDPELGSIQGKPTMFHGGSVDQMPNNGSLNFDPMATNLLKKWM